MASPHTVSPVHLRAPVHPLVRQPQRHRKHGMHPRASVQRHWFGGYSRATVATYTPGSSCIVHHRVGSASRPNRLTWRSCRKILAHLSQELSLSPTILALLSQSWRNCRKASALPQTHRKCGVQPEAACNVTGSAVIAGQPWQRTRQDPHGLKVQLKNMKKVSRLGDPRELSGSLERTFRGTWTLSTASSTLARTSS